MNYSRTLRVLFATILVFGFSSGAFAQATRTWVSGVGDDVNPCSRTAPCKTFAGAISKTATGGEISVLDPGGYGALTITKAITVDGGTGAGWGSTLFASTNGFVINITTNLTSDKVILRNLSLNGGVLSSLGVDGIRFLDGQQLTVENVRIFNFSGDGIEVNQSQASNVFLKNVRITHGGVLGATAANGIKVTSAGACVGTMDDVHIDGVTGHGLQFVSNAIFAIKDLISARNGLSGMRAEQASVNVTVENSISMGNNIGFESTGGSIRLANCGMYNNNTNLTTNVGSKGDNRNAGNTTTNPPTVPGGFTTN
jgi:hypothetical protein